MSHKPGGGLHSKVVKHSTNPKSEPRSRGINPGGVNMLGNHVGDKVTHVPGSTGFRGEDLIRGAGYNNPRGPTSFNNIGPGKGRDVHACGSQGAHGATNPGSPRPNARRDALEQE